MMNESRVVQRDLRGMLACVIFLALGVAIWWTSVDFSPLGSVFPRTIATLMMLLSLLYIVQGVRQRVTVHPESGGSTLRRVLMYLIMLAWALSFEYIGFLTTSLVCFALALLVANYDRWTPRTVVVYFASGVVVIGALYVLFKVLLQVPLPAGLFL